jgi:hypothetical protein
VSGTRWLCVDLGHRQKAQGCSTAKHIRANDDDFLQSLYAAMGHRAQAHIKSIYLHDKAHQPQIAQNTCRMKRSAGETCMGDEEYAISRRAGTLGIPGRIKSARE